MGTAFKKALIVFIGFYRDFGRRFNHCYPELLPVRIAAGNDTDGGFSGDAGSGFGGRVC